MRVEVEASASAEELDALRALLIEFGIDAGVEATRVNKAAVEVVTVVVVIGGPALTTLSAAAQAFGKEIGGLQVRCWRHALSASASAS